MTTPTTMVNSPKPTQAVISLMRSGHDAVVPLAWAPASASMIRPNSTGSANMAPASAKLATARKTPSFFWGPSRASTLE